MNYYMAKSFIETQRRDFKKADGVRFLYKGYEYELRYEGGFDEFFGIYRREQGKETSNTLTAFQVWSVPQLMRLRKNFRL